MKIALCLGHSILKSGACTSANGVVNEYKYNKELIKYVEKWLEYAGHSVTPICIPEKQLVASNEEQNYKLSRVNGKGFDLVVELHLNAHTGSAYGSESYYSSTKGKEVATRIQKKLGTVFSDRGVKSKNFYMLTKTEPVAVLIETFFCDNKSDYEKASSKGYDAIGKLIAEGIHGGSISAPVSTEETYYRVVVGSYKDKASAEDMVEQMKDEGYPAFIAVYKK